MLLRNIPKYEAIQSLSEEIPEVEPDAVDACLRLMKLAGDMEAAFNQHFARHGISRGRFMILMLLYRQQGSGLSPAGLADFAMVSRATITGLLDGLEQDGRVERRPHPEDRRKTEVFLTPAGKAFLMGMAQDHFRRVAGLMEGLTESDRTTLRRLLEKVSDGIPQVRDP